jgi:outer membrane receptor protein involved in Fe transport
VNIVRRQPTAGDLGSLRLGGGSFGTRQGSLDWNRSGEAGGTAFRINALRREGDGYRDGRESEVTAVRPSFTWRDERLGTLNVNVETVTADYRPDAGLPLVGGVLPQVPRERSYASPLDVSEQDILRAQIDWERPLNETVRLRNKLYLRRLDWQTDGTLLTGIVPSDPDPALSAPLIVRTLTQLEDDQRFVGNQFEAITEIGGDRVRHHLLTGVEIARQSDEFNLDVGLLPLIGVFDPVETTTGPPPPLPGQSARGDSDTDILAPYVVDQISVGERWAFTLGARLDRIEFDDAATGTERSDTEASPLLGAVYSPRPGLWLYGSAAGSFAPPSPRVAGDREPEESRQVEIGVRKDLRSDLRLSVAGYRLERENIAIPDDNGFTQQAGDQRSTGLELELAGRLPGAVDAAIAYAWTDAELTRFSEQIPFPPFPVADRSGNRPAFAPEHLASAWFSRSFGPHLRLGGGARWIGEQYIAEDNAARLDGYALLDAGLTWSTERWAASLHLRNLTDEEYETRGFGSFAVIPGEPAAAHLGVEYRW